jgi:hypothetical protein
VCLHPARRLCVCIAGLGGRVFPHLGFLAHPMQILVDISALTRFHCCRRRGYFDCVSMVCAVPDFR